MAYVRGSVAAERLGISQATLRRMDAEGKIKIIRIGGQRRYDVDGFLAESVRQSPKVVGYARVSSRKQLSDLERQAAFLQSAFPEAEIVKDVGSGLGFKRKGLKALLERCMLGERLKVVVAHRDRLARFGIDLIRQVIEHAGGELVVLQSDDLSPQEELTRDILSILRLSAGRVHGLRSYKDSLNKSLSESSAAPAV